jgi:hypothetical protein
MIYIYDPYSIALSKVVRFRNRPGRCFVYVTTKPIELEPLVDYFGATIPQAWDFDIDPAELRQHLAELCP